MTNRQLDRDLMSVSTRWRDIEKKYVLSVLINRCFATETTANNDAN